MVDNIDKESNSGARSEILTREGAIFTILKNGLSVKIPSESLKEQLKNPTLSNEELEQMLNGLSDEQLRSLFVDVVFNNTQEFIRAYQQAKLGANKEAGSLIFSPVILGVIPPEIMARQSEAQVAEYSAEDYLATLQRKSPDAAKAATLDFLREKMNHQSLRVDESDVSITFTSDKDSSEDEKDL